jgi:two-component system sensor histidine kinase YesM
MKISLRSKVILAFMIVIVPIIAFTVYISMYGISVVRTQVAHSNQNLLKLYANQIERTLDEASTYLNKLSLGGPDLRSLNLYDLDSPDYVYAKYNITNKLNLDNEYYDKVNAFFVLRKDPFDIIETNRLMPSEKRGQQRLFLRGLLDDPVNLSGWRVHLFDNNYVLIRIQRLNSSVYAGSWIQLDNLKIPLDLLNLGEAGRAMLISGENQIMADMTGDASRVRQALFPIPDLSPALPLPVPALEKDDAYKIWQDDIGRHYMLMSEDLKFADLKLAVAVLETDVLARLPVFQKLIFILPFVVLVILMFYMLFFRKFLLQPLHALVKGMREASKGNLEVRVKSDQTGELDFLIHSFHDMMDKIKTLQIDVYEETLRTQQAEMKQLQLQIQPHFYLNCLNIIYSLADLRKYEQIQSMAQYLSDYFRFTLHYAESIRLSEEMDHIRNYLEIQRFRYPNRLSFELSFQVEAQSFQLPPLLILPFIENSMKHGMNSEHPFHISISTEWQEQERQLLIRLQDNGRGFSDTFLQLWPSIEYDPEHMGIWNVRRRMNVYFGDLSYLSITNLESGGTQICLLLPFPAGEEVP